MKMKMRWALVFVAILVLALCNPLWADYDYVQSVTNGDSFHWGLTQWTGNAVSLEAAVAGAPDYTYDPDSGTQTGDALGYQQGWGNFVLDFGKEFSGDSVDITFWHFGGFNSDTPPASNNLVFMYVSTDGTNWTPAHTDFDAANTDGYGSRPRGTAGAVQLEDVLSGGTTLYETTYDLQATFGVDAFRYLMIEKIDGGPKTGKFLDAVGVVVNAAGSDYWGGVSAPDWSNNAHYTAQTWTFDTEPSWTDTDLDSDGDTDALIVDGDGYTAEILTNAYGEAVFLETYYGEASDWEHIDEGPIDEDWGGVQGMIGGMGSGSLEFHIPNASQAGSCQLWLQYVIHIPNGSAHESVSAIFASDADFTTPIGILTARSGEQIHELEDAGGTGKWWRVTEEWSVEGALAGQYLRITTADHGTDNLVDSVDLLTRVVANPSPTVTTATPADGTHEVATDTAIAITFSEGMHTGDTEAAISIDPSVSGSFSWSDQGRVATFTPTTDLATATGYTVTVGTGAKDRSGTQLKQTYSFSFTTRAGVETNQAPDMVSPDPQSVMTGSVLRLALQCADPDGDTLAFSYTANPPLDGATFDASSGELVWAPPTGAEGTYTITVTVTDDGTPTMSDTANFQLTVKTSSTNQAPQLTRIGDQNATVNRELRLTLQGADPEGDTLTYSYTADPTLNGASFDTATGELVWTPPVGAEGTFTLTFTASDGNSDASETITLSVAARRSSDGGGGGGGCFLGGLTTLKF
jgi:hypothetical protein